MRVFPDTNILISAFLSHGTCYRLVQHLIGRPSHELLIGEVVLAEARHKLRRKIKAPEEAIDLFTEMLLSGGVASPPPDRLPLIAVRDPDDAWVLASALHVGADVLVTGDRDLLDVADAVDELLITTPRMLWDQLQSEATS
ncbi:MAG TPA: putative toxin-antitoxin system toxin component, PIN family [Longimicrobiaceae bacterium]|jgi:putative PIN family toxin of toxin-antitoxin system